MSTRIELWADYETCSGEVGEPIPPFVVDASAVQACVDWQQQFLEDQLKGLVRQLFLSGKPGKPRQTVFSSVGRVHGSAWVCARTAERLAQNVLDDVCVVDADLQGSVLPSLLGMEHSSGKHQEQGLARKNGGNLWFCSSQTLLQASEWSTRSETLRNRMNRLKKEFAHLVIHAPPMGQEDTALVVGQMAEGLVLVLEAGVTRRAAAVHAKTLLEAAGVNLLGVVLGERNFPIPQSIYQRF